MGGLVGANETSTPVVASYWDTETSGQSTSDGGVGKSTSELQSPTSNTGIYARWDDDVWDFGTSSEYPNLKGVGPVSLVEMDRSTLTALYNATDGPNWTNNTNWLSDRPLGKWHGVTTDANGRVTKLHLSNRGLTGTVPPELGRLSRLEELYLWSNQLTGPLPPELGNLSNLTGLAIQDNQLSGELPEKLGNLSKLRGLHLWGNRLTGSLPAAIGNLTNLETIWLNSNQLSGPIPVGLGNLANLEQLWLSDNQLTGSVPPELGGLSNLTHLYLSNNQLSGSIPLELGDLSNLERLYLAGNRLTGCIPAALLDVGDDNPDNDPDHDLAELGLPLFCDSLLSGLSVSPRSLTPAFDPNHATYEAFDGPTLVTVTASTEHDATIQIIILDENGGAGRVPDADDSLAGYQVDLDSSGVDSGVVAIFVLVVPQDLGASTYTIWVRPVSPCVTGGAVDELANTGLVSDCEGLLAARDTLAGNATLNWSADRPITEWDGVRLEGTPERVTQLFLDRKELSGEIPPELGDLASLRYLNLRLNKLTGTIPPELGRLANLQTLLLSDNNLTGELPPGLTRLTVLQWFWFDRNQGLCAPIGDAFQEWIESIEVVRGSSCAPSDSPEDRAVLVALYNATDGANWTNNTNWLSDRPIREWHGVTSDAGGRVNGLLLGGNQLSGDIPAELGNLANLEFLHLHSNQLGGAIPAELGNLANLEELLLSTNQLTGEIPVELGNLANLERAVPLHQPVDRGDTSGTREPR